MCMHDKERMHKNGKISLLILDEIEGENVAVYNMGFSH